MRRASGVFKTKGWELAEHRGSTTRRSLSGDQIAYLDFIRALAAQLVLIMHFFLYLRDINPIGPLGSLGVVIFFLISGFLIGRSALVNAVNANYTFWDYLIERFARIYTAYIPALLLIASIDYFLIGLPLFPDKSNYDLWYALGNLLMLQNFPILHVLHQLGCGSCWSIEAFSTGHTFWTLPIEWWIYVTFGVLFFSIRRRHWTVTRSVILAFVAMYPMYHFIGRYAGNLTLVWIMGFGANVLYHRIENVQFDSSQSSRWMLAVPLTLIGLAGPMGLARLTYTNFNVYDTTFTMLLAVIVFAPVFISKFHPINLRNPIRSAAHYLASYSYSLYLIHTTLLIAVLVLHREWAAGSGGLILILAGSNLVAFCFAHVFELRYYAVAKYLKALFNRERLYIPRLWNATMLNLLPRRDTVRYP
jgi:peptidoglycan/LPS O-acetylase OafA/YrhL